MTTRTVAATRMGVESRGVGFGAFLFWSAIPLLSALLFLTWARVENRRVQYALSQVAQEERDWTRRALRAEAEWQALSSHESLGRAADMMGLAAPAPHQRWKLK